MRNIGSFVYLFSPISLLFNEVKKCDINWKRRDDIYTFLRKNDFFETYNLNILYHLCDY